MAQLETKYSIGDIVFCLDNKYKIREREIQGIRTQEFANGEKETIYSFFKDDVDHTDFLGYVPEKPTAKDYFWMSEKYLYDTEAELREKI